MILRTAEPFRSIGNANGMGAVGNLVGGLMRFDLVVGLPWLCCMHMHAHSAFNFTMEGYVKRRPKTSARR
jgi:hypothetical protein